MSNFEKWVLRKKNLWINILLVLCTYFIWLIVYLIIYFKNKDYIYMTRHPELYADKNKLRCFHTKVVGVTFDNEDGSSRQYYLSKLGMYDELELAIYEYKPGEDAVGVYYKNKQLGNISAELVDEVIDIIIQKDLIAVIAEPTGSDNKTRGCNLSIITKK